jgi:hypothetical protein
MSANDTVDGPSAALKLNSKPSLFQCAGLSRYDTVF